MKRALDRIEGRDEQLQIRAGDFNISDAIMDRPIIQKINKEIENLNNTLNQLYATDIHRTLPNNRIHIFPKCSRTFSRIEHMLSHKTSLSTFRRTEIIQSIFSDHSETKLEINNKRKTGKFTNMW